MAKTGYTIIVASPKLTRIKKYRFSRFFPRFLTFSLFLILLGLSYSLYDLIQLKSEVFDLDLLRRQNSSQRAQIQWFAIKIKDLKENMARLNAFERKIRITANLQNPVTHNGLSGVGGPQAEEHPLNSQSNKEPEQLGPEIPESESRDRIVGIRNLKTFADEDSFKMNINKDLYYIKAKSGANIRIATSIESKKLGVIPPGGLVELLDIEGEWIRVIYRGGGYAGPRTYYGQGYIHGSLIEKY